MRARKRSGKIVLEKKKTKVKEDEGTQEDMSEGEKNEEIRNADEQND